MPSPTSPRKRALMPSSPLRKTLRGAGHHLSPVVQIGKEGLTEAVLRQLDEALLAHELVKVKVGTESPEDRFEVADRLAGGTDAQVAQILGRTLLVYRRHPERPRFEPRPAAEILADADDAPRARGRAARPPAKRGGPPAKRGGAAPKRGGRAGASGGRKVRAPGRARPRR